MARLTEAQETYQHIVTEPMTAGAPAAWIQAKLSAATELEETRGLLQRELPIARPEIITATTQPKRTLFQHSRLRILQCAIAGRPNEGSSLGIDE